MQRTSSPAGGQIHASVTKSDGGVKVHADERISPTCMATRRQEVSKPATVHVSEDAKLVEDAKAVLASFHHTPGYKAKVGMDVDEGSGVALVEKAASHDTKGGKKLIEFQIDTKAARLVQVKGHISQAMDFGISPRGQAALKL